MVTTTVRAKIMTSQITTVWHQMKIRSKRQHVETAAMMEGPRLMSLEACYSIAYCRLYL